MTNPILKITGQIVAPVELDFAALAAISAEYQINDVSRLVPSRKGDAITLRGLLAIAQPQSDVRYLTLHASADSFHASIPLEKIVEKAFLIYRLDGQPLTAKAGGPFRFFIPDHLACHAAEIDECANVKFVDHLELTVERGFDNRPHDDAEHAKLHQQF